MREIYRPYLRDLNVGQQIVVMDENGRYTKSIIARLSDSSIWLSNGQRFARSHGRLYGYAASFRPRASIGFTIDIDTNQMRLITWDEADAENAKRERRFRDA